MSLEAGLFQLLSTAPALVSIQGARVYPVLLPETVTLPATTFQIVGGTGVNTFDSAGPQRRRIQLDFYADYESGTYDQVVALRDSAFALLNKFSGALPNGFPVTAIFHIQPIDGFESEARRYRCAAEYYVHFNL